MRMEHNLAAALIMLLTAPEGYPELTRDPLRESLDDARKLSLYTGNRRMRFPSSITSGNRYHQERARPGSPEEAERKAAAEAKRARKAARGAQS
jgi:hypothetical protein